MESGVGRGWQKLFFAGLNRLAETPVGKNWQKTQMIKTVCFLVSNCLKCIYACLDVAVTYSALCLIRFLIGDYLKCVYILLGTNEICFSACEVA